MVLVNIPELSTVFEVLKEHEKYNELSDDKQESVVTMLQHWRDEYEYTPNKNIAKCRKCDFNKLKDQSVEGQIKHVVDHYVDYMNRQRGVLWF